ncbi:RND transporter [Tamlana nanhaiensis]|uniref:RND transporter n=1 Tax=Neotamlana nanhaiensis TaxID=1382798 RepID=A0A0D7W5U5_9FLAO|nr:efflux RND transporter periplasmic adaptor subunit [Tamlana nanhaiensis]KJD34506.1 RND transporter [Tamlana nanhaiensis]
MKKYSIYFIILIVGVFLGWLFFGGSSNENPSHEHQDQAHTKQLWTCSMHPQIMQPEPGDCPICGMDLIPAEAGADGLTANQFKLTPNAMALANIQTTVVGMAGAENDSITLSGKIAENEEENAVQVSYFSGRIERLNINFTGEEVRKGQLLTTIYSPELYAAQQELITAASLKASQSALYKAVRNKLKLWKLSENQINNIETTSKVIENFPVYATVSGTVTEKLVAEGDYIKQGQTLLKIANLNTVWGNFDVYENQISLFKKGQSVNVYTKAFANKTFSGVVDFIDPVLNSKTRTVNLRVQLNNKDAVFKPGMFVSAKIEAVNNRSEATLLVPASAVLWTGERSVVYVKSQPNAPIFEMKEVALGNKIGSNYEILNGLVSGSEIVTNGTFTVDAAAQLQGKKSMMNNLNKSDSGEDFSNRLESPVAFQHELNIVYNNYIKVKDALVADDVKQTKEEINALLQNLSHINMELLKGDAHNYWMILQNDIKAASQEISKASDIKIQRNHFKVLSDNMIRAIKSFGINETVFVEYCPMANSDKGAYWLSKEKQIRNPYFGDAMLTCGEVKQIIE